MQPEQSGLAEWDKFTYMDAVADGAAGRTSSDYAQVRKGWLAGRLDEQVNDGGAVAE